MKYKEFKKIISSFPPSFDDAEVYVTQINEDGFGTTSSVDTVVYGKDIIIWSNNKKRSPNETNNDL